MDFGADLQGGRGSRLFARTFPEAIRVDSDRQHNEQQKSAGRMQPAPL